MVLDSSLAVSQTDTNAIALFMAKPIAIASGVITTSSVAGDSITNFKIADQLMTYNVWKNKHEGYNLLRGTARVKLVVNAQPFQAGRLLLHFLPNYQNKVAIDPSFAGHNTTLQQRTVHPCVELDLSETSCELIIPYIAPTMWFSKRSYNAGVLANWNDWGTVWLDILSPLTVGTGSASIDYTLFLSFDDFELAAPIIPESSGEFKRKATIVERKNFARPGGTISGTLDKLREPVKAFSAIPIIGDYIPGALDATLHAFSSLFDAFGWSRPIDPKPVEVVNMNSNYKGMNFNAVTTSDNLALDSMNHITPCSNVAGVREDEMSFAYLKRIPQLVYNFAWTTSNVTGDTLYVNDIIPANLGTVFGKSRAGGSGVNYYMSLPPFAFISRYFRNYRGGITVTLKFVKTQYHSGRVMVTFVPNFTAAATISNSTYVYREIVDLRVSREVTLTLPYMHTTPYLETSASLGKLTVLVLNPLVAPSTVSTSIDTLVYFSAAEDYEVAVPKTPGTFMIPEMDASPPVALTNKNIGGAPAPQLTLDPAEACVGELFVSIKQLTMTLRRYFGTATYTANQPVSGWNMLRISPYVHGVIRTDTTTTPAVSNLWLIPPFGMDYVAELSSGFAYERGGLRYAVPAFGSTQGSTTCSLVETGGTFVTTTGVNTIGIYTNPYATAGVAGNTIQDLYPTAFKSTFGGFFDVVVPHYGKTHIRHIRTANTAAASITAGRDLNPVDLQVAFKSGVDSNVTGTIYRSGADDYSLSYFIGFHNVGL